MQNEIFFLSPTVKHSLSVSLYRGVQIRARSTRVLPYRHFMAPVYLLDKYLDGDSDSPYPRYDIEDVCWLSITDRRITLHNRKGQPAAKCNIASKMSIQKKEDYGTEEKRKNSQTEKHHHIKTYRY